MFDASLYFTQTAAEAYRTERARGRPLRHSRRRLLGHTTPVTTRTDRGR